MIRARSLALPIAALVLALSAIGPAAASTATEADASGPVATLELEGTLLVTAVESEVGESESGLNEYAVVTESGALLSLEPSDELEEARAGDAFAGTVEVPVAIARAVEGVPADASIAASSAMGEALADAAQEVGAELRILDGSVTEADATADAPRDHVVDVVLFDDSGWQPVGAPYTDEQLRELAETSGRFWQQASTRPGFSGITSFTASTSVTRLEWNGSCGWGFSALWDHAAERLGYRDLRGYLNAAGPATGPIRHMVVFQPPKCLSPEGFGFDGNDDGAYSGGTISDGVNAGGLSVVTLGDLDTRITTHVLGHNLGLGHANLDLCSADAVALGCTEYDGADLYDVMGIPVDDVATALNSGTKAALGWNDPATTPVLSLTEAETRRTWTVSLPPLRDGGDAGEPPFVIATDPISGEPLTIEYRDSSAPLPFYAKGTTLSLDGAGGGIVLFQAGVRILRPSLHGNTSVYTAATSEAGVTQAAAGALTSFQKDVIANPSGSVRVRVIGGNAGSYADIEVTLARPDVSQAKPVYRFWSDRFQGHFYTISEAERAKVVATWPDVWSYEGPKYSAFATQVPGTVPLFRFWSERYRSHFYTTDAVERDRVNRLWPDVWADEGVAYYVYPLETDEPNTVRMARFWSPLKSHHFYTADPIERDRVIRVWPSPIWDYEGDAFRVPFTG